MLETCHLTPVQDALLKKRGVYGSKTYCDLGSAVFLLSMRFFTLILVILEAVQLTPAFDMEEIDEQLAESYRIIENLEPHLAEAYRIGEPLVSAAFNGNAAVVDRLIREGADVKKEFAGITPLQAAVRGGDLSIISTLVQSGAKMNSRVLAEACRQGNVDIVKFFIDKGCDFDESYKPDYICDSFPINSAIRAGKLEVVEFLIQHGATSGIRDALNFIRVNPAEMVKLLLRHGADLNTVGTCPGNPLANAVHANNPEIARILIDHGAILRQDVYGRTPFREAMVVERLAVLEVFVESGYAINFAIPHSLDAKVDRMLLLGGAINTGYATAALDKLMKPINSIKSAVAALSTTSPVQAFHEVHRTRRKHDRLERLVAFAFEARKGGVDLFEDLQFRADFVNYWSEQKGRMIPSILSELVYLGCNDLNFFYSVSPFLASADDDMIRHAETAFKFLAGSLAVGKSQSQAKESTRAARGALLNNMIARASNIGLRPVVKALFSVYHEEWKIMMTMRFGGLPTELSHLVMSFDHGPFNPELGAKVIREFMKAIGRQ